MKVRKPYNPAAKAEALAEIARLKAQGAEVNVDQRTGKLLSARQSNVFNLLLARKSITQNQHDAVMRLAALWAAWKGCDGGSGRPEKVDGGSGSAELVTDRQLFAGRQVASIMSRIGPTNRALIRAFMTDYVETCENINVWRVTVYRVTKETNKDKQAGLVIAMCEDIRLVMETPKPRQAA